MSLRPLKFSNYFGHNYDEFVTLKYYVAALKTGKSAKKSTITARKMVMRMILEQPLCAVVLRKQMIDHEKSTFPAIIKAFRKFEEETGYDWMQDWQINRKAQNPNITNLKTGQVIRFVSFDRPESMAGLELEDPRIYYGFLWFEEPMQISDRAKKDTSGMVEKQEEQNYDIMISSAFRGILPHPQAHREIILTFNDWSKGDYWIIRKYIKPFIREDEEVLDKEGKMITYDPSFESGKGIFVLVASGGINEFNDEDYLKFVAEIKKNDPEFYKAIWLGTAAQVTGNAYSMANLSKIKREIDFNDITEYNHGIDYAVSKDYIVLSLVGFNPETYRRQVVDAFRYHRGKEKNPMSEPEMIKFLWNKIVEWSKKYNFAATDVVASIHVDARDATVKSFLQEEWDNSGNIERLDIGRPESAAKWNKASSWIRVMVDRYTMGAGLFHVAPHLDWLMEEYKTRTFVKDGTLKDGDDDGPQSVEYATSFQIENLVPYQFMNTLIEREREMREIRKFEKD